MQLHFHANQNHKNVNALRLYLKQRQKGTGKWPISRGTSGVFEGQIIY